MLCCRFRGINLRFPDRIGGIFLKMREKAVGKSIVPTVFLCYYKKVKQENRAGRKELPFAALSGAAMFACRRNSSIMNEVILHSLMHSLEDCVKQLPFLFLSYLVVEYAEHRMSSRTKEMIYRAGKAGPVLGGLIGIIPQCGFSAAAAGLFAGGMISPGTLIAVFLSTSDEMLPIMVSEGIAVGTIGKILLTKMIVAAAVGLAADIALEMIRGPRKRMPEHPDMCEHGHCGCGEHGIVSSALKHTVHVAGFLFLISLLIGFGMEWFEQEGTLQSFLAIPVIQEVTAGLVGLIPNCAASVLITELFLEGVLRQGALFAGLLCGAGTGLLVLFRENRNMKANFKVLVTLYVSGTAAGILLGMIGIL